MLNYLWPVAVVFLSCADNSAPPDPAADGRGSTDKAIDYRKPDYRSSAPGTCWPPCSQSQYCHLAEGCKQAGAGVCMERPRSCSKILAEVCGCDEQTYGNDCMAKTSGINIQHVGECGGQGDAATSWDAGAK